MPDALDVLLQGYCWAGALPQPGTHVLQASTVIMHCCCTWHGYCVIRFMHAWAPDVSLGLMTLLQMYAMVAVQSAFCNLVYLMR